MSNDARVNAAAVYGSLEGAVTWKDRTWGVPHEAVVLNLPLSFFYEDPCVWGDMTSTPASVLLRALCWIVHDSGLGTDFRNSQFYCSNDRPKTVQIFEELKSAVDESVVAGYRLWMSVLDPQFHLREGFRKLIAKNVEESEDRKKVIMRTRATMSRRLNRHASQELAFSEASGAIAGGMTASPEKKLMNEMALVNRVLALYLGHPVLDGERDIDSLYSGDLLAAGAPYDPLAVMGMDNAFELHMEQVCEEQRDPSNYDLGEADDLIDFNAVFPAGVRASRVLSPYFAPDFLSGTPLPHVARECLGPHFRRLMLFTEDHSDATKRAASIVRSREVRAHDREDAALARERMEREVEEMEQEFSNLRMTAPSAAIGMGSMSQSFNSSYVDEVIRDRDDFRKLYDAFVPITKNIHAKFAEVARARAQAREAGAAGAADDYDDDDIKIDDMTFVDKIQQARGVMLDQFWRTFRISKKVTPTVDAARRWFQKRTRTLGYKGHWSRRRQLAENLSPFGNMVVTLMNDCGDALEIETNFQLMFVTLLVVMCGWEFRFGLRPNMIVTGEAGVGKSFCVEQVEKIMIPGATFNLNHLTQHGMNGNDDICDTAVIIEEAPMRLLGVDEYGHSVAADPYFKNMLTKGLSTSLSLDTSSEEAAGERKSVMSVARAMLVFILLMNEQPPPANSPVMSRFLPYVMHKLTREEARGADRTTAIDMTDSVLKAALETRLEGMQLQSFYVFVWEKAIESGAMPEIDTTNVRIVAEWVFAELARRGVPRASRRHIAMLESLCRIMQMYFGVHMEFFSEYAHKQRDDLSNLDAAARRRQAADRDAAAAQANDMGAAPAAGRAAAAAAAAAAGNHDMAFQPWMLQNLVKWGSVSEEVVVFTMTLLEFLWVPKTRTEILRAVGKLARCGGGDGGTPAFVENHTQFRREFDLGQAAAAPAPAQEPAQEPAPAPAPAPAQEPAPVVVAAAVEPAVGVNYDDDDEYLDDYENEEEEAEEVPVSDDDDEDEEEEEEEAPVSDDDDGQAQQEAQQQQQQPAPAPAPVFRPSNVRGLDYRYIEVCGGSYAEVSQKARMMLKTPPSENDVLSALNTMSGEYIQSKPKQFATRYRDGGEPYQALVDVEDVESEAIPIVVFDTLTDAQAQRSKQRRVCIAVEAVLQDFGPALRDSIQAALAHQFQTDRDYITAFPYVHHRAAGGDHLEDHRAAVDGQRSTVMHNVFDVLHISPNHRKVQVVTNPYARTENEIRVLEVVIDGGLDAATRANIELRETPRFAVRDDIDHTALMRYWMKNGVSVDSVGPAYTPAAREYMQRLYDTDAVGRSIMVARYPRDWAQHVVKRRAEMDKSGEPEASWTKDALLGGEPWLYTKEARDFERTRRGGADGDGGDGAGRDPPMRESVEDVADAFAAARLSSDDSDAAADAVRPQEQQQQPQQQQQQQRRHRLYGEVGNGVTHSLIDNSLKSVDRARKRARHV